MLWTQRWPAPCVYDPGWIIPHLAGQLSKVSIVFQINPIVVKKICIAFFFWCVTVILSSCRLHTGWPMLSDELDSKPEVICSSFLITQVVFELSHPWLSLFFSVSSLHQLLVQFVQNASIPLVQGLEDSESKHSCLPLLAPADSSLCSPLELTGQQLILTTAGHKHCSEITLHVTQHHYVLFFIV